MNKRPLTLLLAALLAGCSNTIELDLERSAPFVLTAEHLAVGAVLVYAWTMRGGSVWDAEASHAGGDRFRIVMRKNRYSSAGDGDAALIFRQTAERVVAANRCDGYQTLEYHERLESQNFGPRRIAEGLIRCPGAGS